MPFVRLALPIGGRTSILPVIEQIMEVNNTAFVSPLANAQYELPPSSGFVDRIAQQVNFWTLSLTLLLLAITYDQCGYATQAMRQRY